MTQREDIDEFMSDLLESNRSFQIEDDDIGRKTLL